MKCSNQMLPGAKEDWITKRRSCKGKIKIENLIINFLIAPLQARRQRHQDAVGGEKKMGVKETENEED